MHVDFVSGTVRLVVLPFIARIESDVHFEVEQKRADGSNIHNVRGCVCDYDIDLS